MFMFEIYDVFISFTYNRLNVKYNRLNVQNRELKTRHKETYKENKAYTERYRNSAIPYMQRLLNEHESVKNKEKKRYI